mgnify:CR=1 FL=1
MFWGFGALRARRQGRRRVPATRVEFGIFRGMGPRPLFATLPFSPKCGAIEGGETMGRLMGVTIGGIAGFQQVGCSRALEKTLRGSG